MAILARSTQAVQPWGIAPLIKQMQTRRADQRLSRENGIQLGDMEAIAG